MVTFLRPDCRQNERQTKQNLDKCKSQKQPSLSSASDTYGAVLQSQFVHLTPSQCRNKREFKSLNIRDGIKNLHYQKRNMVFISSYI